MNSPLTQKHLGDIVAAKQLESLSIAQSGLGTDADIEKLTPLANLKSLVVNGCPLTHAACQSFAKFKKLESLVAPYTKIGGPEFAKLGDLPGLRYLNLYKSNVTDSDLEALKAPAMETLDIAFTQLTAQSLKRLEQFRTLKVLRVGEDQFDAAAIASLRKALPECKIEFIK